jgi:multicomponent Na+:H+ antiporter subunit D
MALHQTHLKKRLAYSTISQLGYMLLGIVLLNEDALLGTMIHLINHAIIKIVLFFCVGAITYMTGKKYIHEIGGIGRKMPKTMMCFSIASISLIGIPPSNGFVSKWFLGLGAMGAGQVMNIVVLLLSAFLTAGYLLPIVVGAFFTRTAEDIADSENLDPPRGMMIPIMIITGFIILMGIFPNPVIAYIRHAMRFIFV